MMQKLGLSLLLLVGLADFGYCQGTQVLSYGYPIASQVQSVPVVSSVVPYQGVMINGVIVDTTPRVTVLVPPPLIVHPVPVVIQPIMVQPVQRCWWPRPWVYHYGY